MDRARRPLARRPRRARGFTLVEVLVAVGIFALIGIVSAALLSRTLTARAEMDARADRLQAVQRGLQRLERDIIQYADRGIRDEFGDPQPALVLDLDGALELTIHGWRNPLGLPRSELQRVRWRLDADGGLERTFWAVLDRAQDSPDRQQTVLEAVRGFDVEVVDGEGGTWREWPRQDGQFADEPPPVTLPGEEPPAAVEGSDYPIALRLAVDVPPFGRIERLLPLGEAVEVREQRSEGGGAGGGEGTEASPATGAEVDDA